MQVTVSMIVGQIGAGISIEDLLTEYPYLERGAEANDLGICQSRRKI